VRSICQLSASFMQRLSGVIAMLLLNAVVPGVAAEKASDTSKDQENILADFEDDKFIESHRASHDATVTLVDDHPLVGGNHALKTVADPAAGAKGYFGTGFRIRETNLSQAGQISFWIKTDIESTFNLQIHSGSKRVSVFRFSTVGSPDKWMKVDARLSGFGPAGWVEREADLNRIDFMQVTAFNSGPYDGKTILLDHVVWSKESNETEIVDTLPLPREPVIVERGEIKEMFDGDSLDGWMPTPRLYVPRGEKFAKIPSSQLYEAIIEHYSQSPGDFRGIPDRVRVKNTGVWKIEDGVLTGGQVPNTILGAYLLSKKKYGDFELTMEINPDYPIDTGIMVRAHRVGTVGFQVLIDNRPNGTIGGVYGNSLGHFFAYPFVFDGDEEIGNKISNLRPGNPNAMKFNGGQHKTGYAASLEDFLAVWKPNDWNELKIRCTGRLPLIETWINGLPIAKVDTATLASHVPNYDSEAIFERIGRQGHIGFEVHDSPQRDRWAPGAKARWRNVRIRELKIKESR